MTNERNAAVGRPTALPEVLVLDTTTHRDDRGNFRELFREEVLTGLGIIGPWVQDNVSLSTEGVLRGIHYQLSPAQGKLVSCLSGAVFDVVVDLRRSSPRFGEWIGQEISEDNGLQMWVPPGFGHAFLVTASSALVHYKLTAPHTNDGYRTLAWNDPDLAIDWPTTSPPVLSDRDRLAPMLADAELPA